MQRVFISSVIQDFVEERKVAKAAVESLQMIAVMAEDFGARPCSPQSACLEGVRDSDIYLGILGSRYGSIGSNEISVTEEEFEEARKRDIPILWLIKECKREPGQEELFKRISTYENGYFVDFFNNPVEQATKITKSLHRYALSKQKSKKTEKDVVKEAMDSIDALKPPEDSGTYLGTVILPDLKEDNCISVLDLGKRKTIDALLQPAFFGESPIFSYSLKTKERVGTEDLVLSQSESRKTKSALRVCSDGALSYITLANVVQEQGGFSFEQYLISEEYLRDRIAAFIAYSQEVWRVLHKCRTSDFWVQTAIYNSETKKLATRKPRARDTFSFGVQSMKNPLIVPLKPMRIQRNVIDNGKKVADDLVELISRIYKCEGLYER